MTIKVLIQVDDHFSFFLNDFPACPRKGDLINLESFISPKMEDDLTEEQLRIINTGSFIVDFVSWEKSPVVYPLVYLIFE